MKGIKKPPASDDGKEIARSKKRLKKPLLIAGAIVLAVAAAFGSYASYIYASSPEAIRKPLLEHYHFRMQILVDGRGENFGEDKYQQDYAKDQCNANLPDQPIHFHDNKDQFVHIHWEGMTGGMVMKYYGWNYIGGINMALGYKLDNLEDIQRVNIHGNFLPPVPEGAKFYVYTGNEQTYKEQYFEDFLKKDLEDFFGTTSNFPAHEENKKLRSGWLDSLFPKVYAHGAEVHSAANPEVETNEEKLTRINNLIGNVIIFVQKDKPTDQQIRDRFNKLEPLPDSTCGG